MRLRLVEPGRSLDAPAEVLAVSLDADRLGETCGSTRRGPDWFELDLAPGRYLLSARTTDGETSRQSLGLVDVPAHASALDFVPSGRSLIVRAEDAVRAASPPVAVLLSVDGMPVAARGLPLTLEPCTGGWRCASLPPGATIVLEGAVARTGRLQREIRVDPSGATELDWP